MHVCAFPLVNTRCWACVYVSLKERRYGAWAIISSDLQPRGQQWNGKEQDSLFSQRCSLHPKGHVMFLGNWLSGFRFYSIRSGCFHSPRVSWGTCLLVVFTLTSLPSPSDEFGLDSLRLPPTQGCLAPMTPCLCPGSMDGCEYLHLSWLGKADPSPRKDHLHVSEQETECENVLLGVQGYFFSTQVARNGGKTPWSLVFRMPAHEHGDSVKTKKNFPNSPTLGSGLEAHFE